MKLKALIVFFLMGSMSLTAQKSYQLQSPDKKLQAVVTVGDDIRFSFTHDGTEVLAASPISMTLQNGVVLGAGPKVSKVLDRKSTRLNSSHPSSSRMPSSA